MLQHAGSGTKSDGGILYSPDGRYLWAARPTDLQRFTVNPDGTVASSPVTVNLPGAGGRQAVPARHGVRSRRQPAGDVRRRRGAVDTTTNTLVKQIGR